MNLIYLIAFTLILLGLLYIFRSFMRRWTGYDPGMDVDNFYGLITRTDWAKRGYAEKLAQAEAEASRKSRKAKVKGYYEAAAAEDTDDMLTDADFSHLEAGYDGETEVIPMSELLDQDRQRPQEP